MHRTLVEEHRPATQVAIITHAAGSLRQREREKQHATTPRREPSNRCKPTHCSHTHEMPFNCILFGAHHQQQRPHQRRRRAHITNTSIYGERLFHKFLQASLTFGQARRSVHTSEREATERCRRFCFRASPRHYILFLFSQSVGKKASMRIPPQLPPGTFTGGFDFLVAVITDRSYCSLLVWIPPLPFLSLFLDEYRLIVFFSL